jgi:putative endonuclease
MTRQRQIGNRGEEIAEKFLWKKGLTLIEKNFHAQGGEIDLIMYDASRKEYVFVEVKTRTSDRFGGGLEAITRTKIQKILKAGESFFLKKMNMDSFPFFRIDAVIVRIDKGETLIEHVEEIGLDDFA